MSAEPNGLLIVGIALGSLMLGLQSRSDKRLDLIEEQIWSRIQRVVRIQWHAERIDRWAWYDAIRSR